MLQVTVWQVCGRLHGGLTPRKVAVFLAVRSEAFGPKRRKTMSAPMSAMGVLSGLVLLTMSFVDYGPFRTSHIDFDDAWNVVA